ncbi:unnamed protein product [Boreogadus saida]
MLAWGWRQHARREDMLKGSEGPEDARDQEFLLPPLGRCLSSRLFGKASLSSNTCCHREISVFRRLDLGCPTTRECKRKHHQTDQKKVSRRNNAEESAVPSNTLFVITNRL